MSRPRYKCLLSKEEILELRKQGTTIKEIACIAGVSEPCIRNYLNPEYNRISVSNYYRRIKGEKRTNFLNDQLRRRKNSQKLSLILKPKQSPGGIGWTTEELEYLSSYVKTKTILEMTLFLNRTYYSVQKAIRRYGISER